MSYTDSHRALTRLRRESFIPELVAGAMVLLAAFALPSALGVAPSSAPSSTSSSSTAQAPRVSSLTWSVTSDGKAVSLAPKVSQPYTLIRQEWTTPGEYRLILAVAGEAGQPPVVHVVPLRIGESGPGPNPDPNPPPPPPPPPPPVPTVLWGIVVEETKDRTPEQAAVISSPKFRGLFAADHFRTVDPTRDDGQPNVIPDDMKPFVDEAKGKALPVLFVTDDKGVVYFEGPLPKTVADAEALIAKIRKEGKQ